MGKRRQARELTLQFLYGYDLNRTDLNQALNDFWKMRHHLSEVEDFARNLIAGTLEHLDYLDKIISNYAQNWRLERIALVDKNILRLALYELYFRDDIPPLVTINEAVDLAKKFSTDQSGRFVNGILDRVRQEFEEKKQSAKSKEQSE